MHTISHVSFCEHTPTANATFSICSDAFNTAADVVTTLLNAVSVATTGSGSQTGAIACERCLTPDAAATVVTSAGCTLSSLLAASGDCDACR
jgi:hypothetical protein